MTLTDCPQCVGSCVRAFGFTFCNPVGAVWIDLSAPSYGIHGTPNPEKIGKTESHGCIRLTNWDALALARMVKKGTQVDFVE